jgi:dsDNA-binding SOS-regulon protein
MAVESRFVVIRHGVEAKTFMDKKSADEYDKMLDMADNLADVFAQSPIALSESAAEELSIYLAQHREEVLVALLAKKAAKPATAKTPLPSAEDAQPSAPVALKSVKSKTSKTSKKSADKSDKKISAAS